MDTDYEVMMFEQDIGSPEECTTTPNVEIKLFSPSVDTEMQRTDQHHSVSTQTYLSCATTTRESSTMTQETEAPMASSKFVNDDQAIHYYTGLETYKKFVMVLHTLGPASHELTYIHRTIHPI